MKIHAWVLWIAVGCVLFLNLQVLLAAEAASKPVDAAFVENFDTTDGWTVTSGATIKAITAKDGTVRFDTVRGTLNAKMKMPNWPDWPEKPFDSNTTVGKDYDTVVDLDVNHYVVVKLDERGTAVTLHINGRGTPVCYTTGLRAFDLKDVGLTGKGKLKLSLSFLNTSGAATFDFIKITDNLTDEEKKVLMPAPADRPIEKRGALPYHGLEALNARAGRAVLDKGLGQLVVYRDTLSGGEVWRLTDQPGDQGFRAGDSEMGFNSDGRYFSLTGGMGDRNVWDFSAANWRKTLGAGDLSDKPVPDYSAAWESTVQPGVMYGYRVKSDRPNSTFTFYRYDRAKGIESEIGKFTTDGVWEVRELSRGQGDRALISLRGTPNVWIVDPAESDPAKVIRYIKLPTRLKDARLANNDAELHWFNCYTYEMWKMNLATGEISLGYYTSGGHAGGGGGKELRHYQGLTIVQQSGMTDWKAGDKVRLFCYYKNPMETDYGKLVDSGRWWLTNGTRADVADQHLLVDGDDCPTVLRLCRYFSSRNNWTTSTYSVASKDATKVAWGSDQLGDGDVYFVVARRPDCPQDLHIQSMPIGMGLTWQPSKRTKETAGYIVYAAGKDGVFKPVVDELVKDTKWAGRLPDDATSVAVAAREWSGLESLPAVVAVGDKTPAVTHLDVWTGRRSKTARAVFDGTAQSTRCVRFFKAFADESDQPTVTWSGLNVPADAKVWIHHKADASMSNAEASPISDRWEWKALSDGYKLDKDKLTVTVPAGVLVDKVIVSGVADYTPKAQDDRFAAPAPVAGLKADAAADGVMTISWDVAKAPDISRVEIYTGADDKFACDNATVIGAVHPAQKQQLIDWANKPGSSVTYKAVAVSTQGVRSGPVSVTAKIPAVEKLVYVEGVADADKPAAGLQKVKVGDSTMLAATPTKAAEKADPKACVPLELKFDVPVDGQYSIWVRYCPNYTPRMDAQVSLDDGPQGTWTMRAPYRLMMAMFGQAKGKQKVYVDRLILKGSAVTDTFALKAGSHTVKIMMDPTMPDGCVHAVEKAFISNDPSYRPAGYDPRADFEKISGRW